MSGHEKLGSAIAECRLHAEILREDLAELGEFRFAESTVTSMSRARRRLLDQLAYRFTKLQDTMGLSVFPGLLEALEEPLSEGATFAEKLQRLERLGALDSVPRWRVLRELRNQLSHEYVDAPALKAAALNRFIDGADTLLRTWETAEQFAARHGLPRK